MTAMNIFLLWLAIYLGIAGVCYALMEHVGRPQKGERIEILIDALCWLPWGIVLGILFLTRQKEADK
jgi:uncharacterized membrane protein HdeD (DUF308 family)